MVAEPIMGQLRYRCRRSLEIGLANNSTIVFPIPIDLLTALSKAADALNAPAPTRACDRRRGAVELLAYVSSPRSLGP